jgi:hypothetical protein
LAAQPAASRQIANVRDFGAIGDGRPHPLSERYESLTAARAVFPHAASLSNEIDWAATQKAIDSLTRGGIVYLPVGTYKLNKTLTIGRSGVSVEGEGGHAGGQIGDKPTGLHFSDLPSGADAIAAIGPNPRDSMKGVKFRRFFVEMRGSGTGGAAVKCFNCSGVDVEDVAVHVYRGANSYGIQFGDLATSRNAVIASSIRGCTVVSHGTPILIGAGCTSVSVEHCYSLGQSSGGIVFKHATYCAVTASAADSGEASGYGYRVEESTGIVFAGCGAENNGKGFVLITGGSTGITLVSCRGVGNNVSADARIGSFVEINSAANYDVQIIGCTDTKPNGATTRSIRGGPGTLHTTIIGYNATAFPKGIGGDATWLSTFVTIISGGATETPALTVSNQLTSNKGAVLASAPLPTNATTGFVGIPGCRGAPTGTPDATFGRCFPLVYDYLNNQLYVWNGGWKKTGALS